MDEGELLERERRQIEQIRELDEEELQIEEVDSPNGSSDGDDSGGHISRSEYTFDAGLASLHTYLGEVEDTHHRRSFLDNGAILNLPLFYLEGVVLFPEATLPLRVIDQNFVLAVERALGQVDAPCMIGVLRVHRDIDSGRLRSSTVGTTAEIRKYRRLEDGSVNIVTRGQQRFHVIQRSIDVDRVPCGEVQIIQEDVPLRTPQDAFGTITVPGSLYGLDNQHPACSSPYNSRRVGFQSDTDSDTSFESELTAMEMRFHQSAIESCHGYDAVYESTSSEDEKTVFEPGILDKRSQQSHLISSSSSTEKRGENEYLGVERKATKRKISHAGGMRKGLMGSKHKRSIAVSRAFLPYWVYQMYDSFYLAKRAAEKWKQIIGIPIMDGFIKKPDILSFYIASKIPVSESTRQELLEIDGISYRLRREIELLEKFDCVCCKNCQSAIAKRRDMLVMSSEGPLGAYVNSYGSVHEVMTLLEASGLALIGRPVKEYSWFPGYAWTIIQCATCATHMGWLFTATNKKLKPKSFWGIRCSQVASDAR